tara:strand:+ start:140 stop:559 length:420 start_codon:yes stop_codon:yes gene_type:complete
MKKISYHFEGVSFSKKNLPKKTWFINCAKKEKKNILAINFIFCPDNRLKQLNNRYLNHNTHTDVITIDHSIKSNLLGDVFISIERVKENSVSYKTTFSDELARVMIHGLLHMAGYSDLSSSDKKKMRNLEDKYLKEKNI